MEATDLRKLIQEQVDMAICQVSKKAVETANSQYEAYRALKASGTVIDVWEPPKGISGISKAVKKEKKNMKCEKILKLWRDEKIFQIRKDEQNEIEKAIKEDSLNIQIREAADQLNKLLLDNGFSQIQMKYEKYTEDYTNEKVEAISEKYSKKNNCLLGKYSEIQTMLSACDTYEQEMDVLKAYKVVNEDGTLFY